MPAMCEPGPYRLGEVDVELHSDGSVVLRGGTRLAGSALRMDRALENAITLSGISLREALVLATTNPARAGRIAGRQRGLVPGEKADFVRFAWDATVHRLTVLETIVAGRTIYSRSGGN
jgi:N-acetylglucosamine-6-phosphate deacetylase